MESPQKKYKVCFIIVYFGELPTWFKYLVKSIKHNTDYCWFFFSNIAISNDLPLNLKFYNISLSEFEKLVKEKLGLETKIIDPYKICDFKPAFGHIFSDFLGDYDYWGYSDIDIILGDLNSYLHIPLREGADVISPEKELFPGHFCVFKNSEKINGLYKRSKLYTDIFISERCYFFDEFLYHNGINLKKDELERIVIRRIKKHKRRIKLKETFCFKLIRPFFRVCKLMTNSRDNGLKDFNSILFKAQKKEEINVYAQNINGSDIDFFCRDIKSWEVNWEKGRLLLEEKEILYFHFQMSKSNSRFKFSKNPRGFSFYLK